CSRCHGTYGQGDTGPMLFNRELLAAASDFYLAEMIAHGRRGTAMFGWRTDVASTERLSDARIADIIAFLRQRGDSEGEIIYAGANLGQAVSGEKLYRAKCADCHGEDGEGPKAPALDNQELLNAATNGYLLATVSLGRENTAMPSWGRGDAVHDQLSIQERHDAVAFLRRWQVVIITNVK
ncbi:c-type cytochrome, partial [candidate division KSB1 bacterium]|nr:c-type cytochrome [candidate division KSB1 bacterium]